MLINVLAAWLRPKDRLALIENTAEL